MHSISIQTKAQYCSPKMAPREAVWLLPLPWYLEYSFSKKKAWTFPLRPAHCVNERNDGGKGRGRVTVPASEAALDLSPLCWSRLKRQPEARRTSHTFTLLSALKREMEEINFVSSSPCKWTIHSSKQKIRMIDLLNKKVCSDTHTPVFVCYGPVFCWIHAAP